jgi:hypothetical protein
MNNPAAGTAFSQSNSLVTSSLTFVWNVQNSDWEVTNTDNANNVGVTLCAHGSASTCVAVGPGGVLYTTTGGSTTRAIAAGTGTTVIKNSAGRLVRCIVTAAGTTGNLTIYDNASTGSGTVLLIVPGATNVATAAIGSDYVSEMPAALGITAVGATGSPAVTCSYY